MNTDLFPLYSVKERIIMFDFVQEEEKKNDNNSRIHTK